jgi:hypothetical protein
MVRLDYNRILRIGLALLSVGLVAWLALVLIQRSTTQHLTLAAGASSGESYILSAALKTVVERHYPHIRINLLETGGTVENLQLLEDGAPSSSLHKPTCWPVQTRAPLRFCTTTPFSC